MTDTEIRVQKLRRTPLYANEETYPYDYLLAVMDDALAAFLEHTHRREDLGEEIDSIIIELCKGRLNKMGLEGSRTAGEGGVSQAWEIEPWLISRMSRYKMMQGMRTGTRQIKWSELSGDPADSESLMDLIRAMVKESGGADLEELEERISDLEKLVDRERYIHIQEELSDTWEVSHGLDRYVSVAAYSDGSEQVEGAVTIVDDNNVIIQFNHMRSGTAVIQ